MRESDLWAFLGDLKWDFAERIECGGVGAGFPDVHVVSEDVSRFIELKRVTVSGCGTIKCLAEVRPAQVRWHTMFQMASPRSWFMLGFPDGKIGLLNGKFAKALKHGLIKTSDVFVIKDLTLAGLLAHFEEVEKEQRHAGLGNPKNTTSL